MILFFFSVFSPHSSRGGAQQEFLTDDHSLQYSQGRAMGWRMALAVLFCTAPKYIQPQPCRAHVGDDLSKRKRRQTHAPSAEASPGSMKGRTPSQNVLVLEHKYTVQSTPRHGTAQAASLTTTGCIVVPFRPEILPVELHTRALAYFWLESPTEMNRQHSIQLAIIRHPHLCYGRRWLWPRQPG